MLVKPVNPIKRKYLLEKRKEKNLSTKEIALILGISPTHYNDIENGKRNPSIELSLKMSEFFKIPLTQILRGRTQFVTKWPKNFYEVWKSIYSYVSSTSQTRFNERI